MKKETRKADYIMTVEAGRRKLQLTFDSEPIPEAQSYHMI